MLLSLRSSSSIWCLASILLVLGCGNDTGKTNNMNNTSNNKMDMSKDTTKMEDMPKEDTSQDTEDMKVEEDMPKEMGPELPPGDEVVLTSLTVFPPVPMSCDMPGGRYRIPFILDSDLVRPAVFGDRVNGVPLIPLQTVNTGSLSSSRTRVGDLATETCEMTSDCAEGFTCGVGGLPGAVKQCIRRTGLTFLPGTSQMDFDPGKGDKEQVVSLLFENSGGLVGFVPKDVGSLHDDMGMKDVFENEARATDKDLVNRKVIEDFIVNMSSVTDSSKTKMSVWWFAGDRPVDTVPLTRKGELTDHFDRDLSVAAPLIKTLPTPNSRLGTSNLYQAIHRVVEKDLALPKYKDAEKFLFVVADGPNEVHDPEATSETVLKVLEEHNIHLFILHFDTKIDPSTNRDLLSYWKGGQLCRKDDNCAEAPTCASDADCENFESCRKAKVYGETDMDPVTETPVSYCMPKYTDGRIGPMNVFADMACRTGGNYIYVPGVEEMRSPLRSLPSVIDGQWSLEADISHLDTRFGVKEGFYRLSGVILGVFGNSSVGAKMTAPIPDSLNPAILSLETRPVVRLGQVKNK